MYNWTNINDLEHIVSFIEKQCSGERLNEERLNLIKLLTDEYYNSKKIEIKSEEVTLNFDKNQIKTSNVKLLRSEKISEYLIKKVDEEKNYIPKTSKEAIEHVNEILKQAQKDLLNYKNRGVVHRTNVEPTFPLDSKENMMDDVINTFDATGVIAPIAWALNKAKKEDERTHFILHKAISDMQDLMEENENLKRVLDNSRENLISEMQERINELKEIKHKKDIADEFMKNENDFEDGYIAGKVNELECWIDKIKKM